jgi:hypothetical protein
MFGDEGMSDDACGEGVGDVVCGEGMSNDGCGEGVGDVV